METLRFIFDFVLTIMKKEFVIFDFEISFFSLFVYSVIGFLVLVIVFKSFN